MIHRYCKNYIQPSDIVLYKFEILSFKTGEDGNLYPAVVEDKTDMSVYGSFYDWSLSSMASAGIDPKSFTSPVVSQSRLEASDSLLSIDLSDINSNPTE